MRVFVAGATGALGRSLVPRLVKAGHEVIGMTRSESKEELIRGLAARPVVCDVFEFDRLCEVLVEADPDVVIHQLTAIPQRVNPRKHAEEFAETNRLRTEGTRHLLDAAIGAGAGRFIAQSIAFAYAPGTTRLATEEEPLDLDAAEPWCTTVEALHELENRVVTCDRLTGVVLRYGFFYGPGTAYALDGHLAEEARRGRLGMAGRGDGIFSFIHVDDAAEATVLALDHGGPGIYNIVDDDPAPAREWMPFYADAVNGKKPRHAPRLLVRAVAGKMVTDQLTRGRGASNAKAKRELGWQPRYPSWSDGFRDALG